MPATSDQFQTTSFGRASKSRTLCLSLGLGNCRDQQSVRSDSADEAAPADDDRGDGEAEAGEAEQDDGQIPEWAAVPEELEIEAVQAVEQPSFESAAAGKPVHDFAGSRVDVIPGCFRVVETGAISGQRLLHEVPGVVVIVVAFEQFETGQFGIGQQQGRGFAYPRGDVPRPVRAEIRQPRSRGERADAIWLSSQVEPVHFPYGLAGGSRHGKVAQAQR